MKFEYLQVFTDLDGNWIANDGNSICDGDKDLLTLLNRLGQDRWEYIAARPYIFMKRSLP